MTEGNSPCKFLENITRQKDGWDAHETCPSLVGFTQGAQAMQTDGCHCECNVDDAYWDLSEQNIYPALLLPSHRATQKPRKTAREEDNTPQEYRPGQAHLIPWAPWIDTCCSAVDRKPIYQQESLICVGDWQVNTLDERGDLFHMHTKLISKTFNARAGAETQKFKEDNMSRYATPKTLSTWPCAKGSKVASCSQTQTK